MNFKFGFKKIFFSLILCFFVSVIFAQENENTTRKYYLGIIFKVPEDNFANNIYYGFWDTVDFSVSILDNVKELFIGNVGVDQLTGPVGISEVVVKTENSSQFIYILALISLSLGVTNLLPIPPLDGSKVLSWSVPIWLVTFAIAAILVLFFGGFL